MRSASPMSSSAMLRSLRPAALIFTLSMAPSTAERGHQGTDAGVGYRIGIALGGHCLDDFKDFDRGLHCPQGHLCRVERGLLKGFGTGGLLCIGSFGHGEDVHDSVERFGVFIHEHEQFRS